MRPLSTVGFKPDVESFLANAAGRHVLILATESTGLTAGECAVQVLHWHLQHAGATVQRLDGVPQDLGIPPAADKSFVHEKRWLAASHLHELIEAAAFGETRVIYADPWAVAVDPLLAKQGIPRLLVEPRIDYDEHSDYWQEIRLWALAHQCEATTTVDACLGVLANGWWEEQMGAAKAATGRFLPTESPWVLLYAEGTADGLESQARALRARIPASYRILSCISPTQVTQGLSHACDLVINPEQLTPPLIADLLSSIKILALCGRWQFGDAAMDCLRPGSKVLTQDRDSLPPTWRKRWEPIEPRESTRIAPELKPSESESPGSVNAAAGRWTAYYSQLANLVQKQNQIQAPILASQEIPLDFALLLCCHKYLQRFRIFMQSVVRQSHPLDRIEICVAAPGNPDGLFEYANVLRIAHPGLRLKLIEVEPALATNKGKMLNAAFDASTAPLIAVTDCDLVLPRDFVARMLTRHRPDRILGCWRTPLDKTITAQVIAGNLDPVEHFDVLRQQWDENEYTGGCRQGLLGYCQVISREAFAKVRYPEEYEGFNQSDVVFIDRLQALGLKNDFMEDYYTLHLSHHRDWTGTKVFL